MFFFFIMQNEHQFKVFDMLLHPLFEARHELELGNLELNGERTSKRALLNCLRLGVCCAADILTYHFGCFFPHTLPYLLALLAALKDATPHTLNSIPTSVA